jgi:hypothetical protein
MFAPRIRPRKSKGGANGSLGVSSRSDQHQRG